MKPDPMHWHKALKAAERNGCPPKLSMADLRAIAEIEARVDRLERAVLHQPSGYERRFG